MHPRESPISAACWIGKGQPGGRAGCRDCPGQAPRRRRRHPSVQSAGEDADARVAVGRAAGQVGRGVQVRRRRGRRECVRPSRRGGGTDRPTGWRCATALGGLRPLVVMSVAIREVVMMVVVMMMRHVVMRVGQTSYLPTQGSTTSSPSEVAGRKGAGGKLPFRYEHARARAPAATMTGAVMLPLDAWLMSRRGGERFRSGEAQRGADGPTCLITDPGFQCRQPNAAQVRGSPFRRDGMCLFQARGD